MTDCVGWSYNILDDDQRKVLDRLSVFVGSFSLDAVHALCSPDLSTERATESVRALVEASLVAVVRHGGTVRYRLLAMTREYAAGQLAAAGTREDMRHRHARYLAAWCAQADRGIRGPDEQRWHQQFEQQWDDIRAAFHHASAQGDHDLMSDIVWHCRYWAEMRLRMEVGDWAETVVRTAPESHAGMPIALSAAAAFARLRDDRRRASEHLDRAEALEARFGAAAEPWVPFERARLTRNSGNSGDLPTLRNVIERGDGDPFWACLIDFVHLQIAVVAEVWNDTTPDPTVVRGVDDALARATALGNPTLLARAYGMLADTERCRSTNDGLDSLERMIELGRTVGNAQVVREAYMDIVQMRGASEDPMSALRLADELITLYSTANAKEPASSIAYATFPALLAVGEHQVAAIIDALLSRGARPEWRQYFTPRHLVEQLAATGGNGAPARLPRDIDELISLIHAAIRRAITRERS